MADTILDFFLERGAPSGTRESVLAPPQAYPVSETSFLIPPGVSVITDPFPVQIQAPPGLSPAFDIKQQIDAPDIGESQSSQISSTSSSYQINFSTSSSLSTASSASSESSSGDEDYILAEDGDILILENGDYLIHE